MAGQQENAFRNQNLPDADFTAAPSVQTTPARATATHVDEGATASALNALSNSFGQFFGGTMSTLQQVNQVTEAQRKQDIVAENKAIAAQGTADALGGRKADIRWQDRTSYSDAYTTGVAQIHSSKMTTDLALEMDKASNDGSVDPEHLATTFFTQHWGNGTGDASLDSKVLTMYQHQALGLIAQKREKIAQQQESTATQSIVEGVTSNVRSPTGITVGQAATGFDSVLSVTHGNTEQASKLFFSSVVSGVDNVQQGLAAQSALEKSGLAERFPQEYDKTKQAILARVQQAKDIQAQTIYNDLTLGLQGAIAANKATPEFIAGWMADYQTEDSKYGFGMHGMAPAFTALKAAAKKQAGVNVVTRAFSGLDGTDQPAAVANKWGVPYGEIVTKHLAPAMTDIVQNSQGQFPDLAQSSVNAGSIDPMASDGAARDYVKLLSLPHAQEAFLHTQPKEFEDRITSSLHNTNDPAAVTRAYTVIDGIAKSVGVDRLGGYFHDESTVNRYLTMKALAPTGDIGPIATYLKNNPADAKLLERASESGTFDFSTFVGKDTKKADVQAAILKSAKSQYTSDTGTSGLVWDPKVGISTDDMEGLTAQVARNLLVGRAAGGISLDDATKAAVQSYTGTRYAVPGTDGSVRIIANPFPNGEGRDLQHPLNGDASGPISTANGYKPVYGSFPIKNALGEIEKPIDTARDDLAQLHSNLRGKVADGDQIYLGNPDAKLTGLMPVTNRATGPVRFVPGEKITLTKQTDGEGHWENIPDFGPKWVAEGPQKGDAQAGEVPKDPKAATQFFKDNLPPGFYAVQDGQGTYSLYYGFRIKGDLAARDAQLKANEARFNTPAARDVRGINDLNKTTGVGTTF
jgi:hypothetical protein